MGLDITDRDGYGNTCDPDFNQDCIVNVADLGVMKANFFVNGDLDTELNHKLVARASS